MNVLKSIKHVAGNFSRIYLGGIPSLLNNDGAYLSFICSLSAIEALGGFLNSSLGNGKRFREFVERYFPDPYRSQAGCSLEAKKRRCPCIPNGTVQSNTHSGHLHLTQDRDGLTLLNAAAEDEREKMRGKK